MLPGDALEMSYVAKSQAGETTKSEKFLVRRDLGMIAILGILGLSALMSPERTWSSIARQLALWRIAKRGSLTPDELAIMRAVVGDRSTKSIEEHYWVEWLGHKYHAWMQLLACYPPRRWRPMSLLAGERRIEMALAAGRGAILWSATFAYNDLHTKSALTDAGYAVSLLSRETHGFSDTWFGRRMLNPLYTRIERRFLQEFIVIKDDQTKGVLDDLRARLEQNELVLIYVVPLGRRIATMPFCHGQIRIATGVLSLAYETGASVLPVFTTRQPDGDVVTAIEAALPVPADLSRGDAIDAALNYYVPLLEAYVSRYPDQFCYPISEPNGSLLIEPTLD